MHGRRQVRCASRRVGLNESGAGWLRRRAENVLAALLAVMFVAFIVQIVFRYLLNFPIGWTSELTVIAWLWLVLWGAAFVVKESEEIRFDLIYGAVGPAHAHRHGDRHRRSRSWSCTALSLPARSTTSAS